MKFFVHPSTRPITQLVAVIIPVATLTFASLASSASIQVGVVNGFLDSETESNGMCTHTIYREEWRSLSAEHRKEYIQAIKCAHALPNQTTYQGVRSRLDDFQAVHIHTAQEVHDVAHFLPWHRRYLRMFEKMLRDECGFRGALPYWDWTLDGDKGGRILDSPIFDAEAGFGGDGVEGTLKLNFTQKQIEDNGIDTDAYRGCVMDGPFAHPGFQLHLGPGKLVGDHCLSRGVNSSVLDSFKSSLVQRALTKPNYDQFRRALSMGSDEQGHKNEHTAGHYVIGGELSNLYSSPAEPIFFLHHANLDRVWWKWQTFDPKRRLADISGPDSRGHNISLNYALPFGQFNVTAVIKDVMDLTQYPLCYDYR
ncbi:hypothetical protein BJ165DRAFT_917274 [Panaeolus papilionaceus]|nr:hypothetical protein BJ165DRAFT_917274 [Panaeolus papilionaceus]